MSTDTQTLVRHVLHVIRAQNLLSTTNHRFSTRGFSQKTKRSKIEEKISITAYTQNNHMQLTY